MKTRNPAKLWCASLLLLASLAGCSSSPTAPDTDSLDTSSTTSAETPLAPVSAANTTPAPIVADLTAAVTAKVGGLLNDFSCTVTVTNPSSIARTGSVTVTFVHDATPETGSPPQTQSVSVPANGTLALTFKDTKYHVLSEDATVTVTSDPVPSAATAAPGSAAESAPAGNYPAPPAGGYGNTN